MKYKLIIDKDREEEIIAVVHAPSSLTQRIEDIVQEFSGGDTLIGYKNDEICKLLFTEIDCITILDRRVTAIDKNGERYFIKERLRDLENILPTYFIRINKSALANEHRIKKFSLVFSGAVDAVFECGYREYVSRRCFAEIKRRYEKI